MHDGDYRAPDKITVGDYLLHRWLPSKRTRVKPSTANSYERNIRLHINPNIGAIPLQRLQPEDLDELYVKLLTDGKRNGDGGGLSAKSVRNVHATLQSALSDAARKGTVARNVADTAATPDSTTCHPSATNNTTNPRLKPHNHPVSTKPGQLQSDFVGATRWTLCGVRAHRVQQPRQ